MKIRHYEIIKYVAAKLKKDIKGSLRLQKEAENCSQNK